MTQPVELPGWGKLDRASYTKEELIDVWHEVVRLLELPIHCGEVLHTIERDAAGLFLVKTQRGEFRARHVCLALGRRGTPNKLGVPGEELPKVSYTLIDAHALRGRRILVVGGGDSAVEAALGLAEQPDNVVTMSYRREAFFRLKARNETHLKAALAGGRIQALLSSQVRRIGEREVEIVQHVDGVERELLLENDEVIVLAGGVAPFQLLEKCGVSFDPRLRKAPEPLADSGTGLTQALLAALGLALGALGWVFWHRGYYALELHERIDAPEHAWLRPYGVVGLACGIGAVALIASNLAYLARRAELFGLRWFGLRRWMTAHVVTGILALLFALIHGAMAPRATLGGHALTALAVLVLSGAIGRYFYAFVPRAANGRELVLEEVHARLAALAGEWDRGNRAFGERVRARISDLSATARWRASFVRRVAALFASQRALRRALGDLEAQGRAEGVPEKQLGEMLALARKAHRASMAAAHFEDLRALMSTWRYLHRWVALYMVLVVILHVVVALRFADAGGS
jgi:hypothetical protein